MKFRIKEAREAAGYKNQKEFAELLGLNPSTFNGYEKGNHDPKSDLLSKIADMCNVSVDYLLNRAPTGNSTIESDFSGYEIDYIQKYRALDEHGKKMVDFVLDEETSRLAQNDKIIPINKYKTVRLKEYEAPVSAGAGVMLDDENERVFYYDAIENDYTKKADFVLRVYGSSMEPRFHDGDRLLVRNQSDVNFGEVGIFTLSSMGTLGYVKVKGHNELVSINKEHPNIPINPDDELHCNGLVVGVLDSSWVVSE